MPGFPSRRGRLAVPLRDCGSDSAAQEIYSLRFDQEVGHHCAEGESPCPVTRLGAREAITAPISPSTKTVGFWSSVSADRKVWSHAAVVFATAYAVLVSTVYFVQLTLVAPRLARGQIAGIETWLFVPFDSFLYAVDILGYSFMSVATLFAAPVFTGGGLRRVVRWFLTANGLLLPFIALQMYAHSLIWIAALWAVTFPGSTEALAVLFRRAETGTPGTV